MEITQKIYDAHRQLSATSAQFLEFIQENPDSLERSSFAEIIDDQRFKYFRRQGWPTFINRDTKKKIAEASANVFNLIKTIPHRLFDYDAGKISSYYALSDRETQWILYGIHETTIQNLLGRGDFIFSQSGGFKCIEFNIHCTLGGWEIEKLEALYINNPVISRFIDQYQVEIHKNRLFSLLMEHIRGNARPLFDTNTHKELNLAILLPEDFNKNGEFTDHTWDDLWDSSWKKNNPHGEIFICDLRQLHLEENRLMYKKKQVHALLELMKGRIPLLFMDAVKRGNLSIHNGTVSLILANKLNLALLSENENSGMFTPEEKEIIRKYIPWTRKVVPGETTYKNEKVKLENFIISNREQLILKPAVGFGGYDVWVGFNTPPGQWKQQVDRVFPGGDWVVQEYTPSRSYLYQEGPQGCVPCHTVFGLFIFGSCYAGGFVRLLPVKGNKGVINAYQGAVESILIEVEE